MIQALIRTIRWKLLKRSLTQMTRLELTLQAQILAMQWMMPTSKQRERALLQAGKVAAKLRQQTELVERLRVKILPPTPIKPPIR